VRKAFTDVQAVDGLDLEVERGECFGCWDRTARGRPQPLRFCEGLTTPVAERWSCWVELEGECAELRQRIGIQLQETQFSEKLTVEETLRLFRSFFKRGISVDESIKQRSSRKSASRA